MKISKLLAALLVLAACSSPQKTESESEEPEAQKETQPMEAADNTLSDSEEAEGWMLLFDGETSDGWRGYGKEGFPAVWQVQDESLYMTGQEKRTDAQKEDAGDIIYDQQFSNFHLKLDWKISEGGNSGIFYLGQEDLDLGPIYMTAPEMQVLDNDRHPDANMGKDGNRKAGSLYDLIPADPQNTKPAGEWNSVEVIKQGNNVKHFQNGELVVEYEFGMDEWNELVSGSKFPGLNPNWANLADQGYIGLQDHGNDVWFKNIKIKEL